MPVTKQHIIALVQGRQLEEAKLQCEQFCQEHTGDAEAWYLLGAINGQRGDLLQARECFERAVAINPAMPVAHFNIATLLQNDGRADQAAVYYRRAIDFNPSYVEAHFGLATVLQGQGNHDGAAKCYRTVIALNPSSFQAHVNLGIVLQQMGDQESAAAQYRAAVRCNPESPEAHNNLGATLQALNRPEEAAQSYRKVLELDSGSARAQGNLGLALWQAGRLEEAEAHCRQALVLDPGCAEACNTLGLILSDQGQLDCAVTQFRRAFEIDANSAQARGNLLFTLNHMAGADAAVTFAEHLRWGEQHADPLLRRSRGPSRDHTTGRRLRIGYVSPDFRFHSVGFFIEPVLAAHDRTAVEVYGYASVAHPDAMTARMRERVDQWRDIVRLDDERAAQLVEDDQIDILVDLAGHTGEARLGVFARKPAPVQATYLGYLNTTGMKAMDYRITDAWADPPGQADSLHCETLVRLPSGLLCFSAPAGCPEVAPLPADSAGHITFGCFSNSRRIGPTVVATWSRILRAQPDARLVLKSKQFSDDATLSRYRELFSKQGIEAPRIQFEKGSGWIEYLESYGRIDIMLDPFPYAGGTVTCQSLWMGVPVITLAGRIGFARTGASILSTIGLTQLIAHDEADYESKALALARDRNGLRQLRSALRQLMQESPLMDAKRCAASLEASYRWMWERWCNQEQG